MSRWELFELSHFGEVKGAVGAYGSLIARVQRWAAIVGAFREVRVKARGRFRVMGQLKPRTSIDAMKSERFIALALLSAVALTTPPRLLGCDSSSSGSSRSSSSSSSSGSSADWDDFMADCCWNSTVSQFGFAAMMGAAEPYSRRRVAYKVGPERYSFARLEREYGAGDASCKAAFRFHYRDLRRLHAAMHFPDEIDTGHEMVPGEEAFLIMLKRPAACQKSPALTLTSYMADWSAAFAAAPHSQPRGRGFSHAPG